MADQLEVEFHEGMLNVYRRAKSECGYSATRFLQMVSEQGGLQAAKTLLYKEGYSDGFVELWQYGRLDISMEALILREPWSSLFTPEELAIARRRLQELGFKPT